jgi:ABC-type phosphate transport system substrate-binding protein
MKRIFSLIIVLAFVLAFAACGNIKPADPAVNDPTGAPAETSAPEETAAPAVTDEPAVTAEPTEVPGPTEVPAMSNPTCALAEYPRVDGSTANIPLAMGLVKIATGCTDEEAENSIHFTTTDPSYQALYNGDCDMLLVYEASKPTKKKYDPAYNMDMRPIGLDALVFITNAGNPVEELTIEQIQGIFSGEITNWKEVGGLDQQIKAFQRPTLSGSQTLMLDLCMKKTPMADPEVITVSDTMADVIDDIEAFDNSANAIGYSVYYYAQNMYTFPNLKFIRIAGVTPTNETINSGEYPFINPFYAILPKENADPLASAIVDWLESRDGQYFVSQCGYVPYMKGIAQ